MQEIILKVRFFETIIKKPLKRQLSFFFRTQSLSIDKFIKKGPGTSEQSLFGLQNKFRKILLLFMYLAKFNDVI